MEFDVASVRQDKRGGQPTTNVPLFSDMYRPTGGIFRATNWSLGVYICFAYGLTNEEAKAVLAPQVPAWVFRDNGGPRFDIEARSDDPNITKEQMRAMMGSLLADRFKLAAHFETRQVPVYALVLAKPGKTGPKLRAQPPDGDPPCANCYSVVCRSGTLSYCANTR